MTQAADLALTNGRVRTLSDSTASAVAVRDGRIVRVGNCHEVDLLTGVETRVIDLDGRVLLPGFIDAHTHLDVLGQQEVEADLTDCETKAALLDRLDDHRERTDREWVIGFGYDENRWNGNYLTRGQLDAVSDSRPVVAFREDLHLASVNSVVLERFGETFPPAGVESDAGEPTGVLTEGAVETLRKHCKPGPTRMRTYLLAAQEHAHSKGVTTVHDMVRRSAAPRVYRELEMDGALTLRVRLNYWADHLDAVFETGLVTNAGTDRLQIGAIKTFADGSFGGRTARLSEEYVDGPGRGEWITPPGELGTLVERVDDAGLQMAVHAIGDEAIESVLDAYEGTTGGRHRIEHAELQTDAVLERLTAAKAIVSGQPNFLKWARRDGLYDSRLGLQRRKQTNQFGRLQDAGTTLAFGSDCMPLDPLFGIEQAVTAPEDGQRLDVTAAIRAYTVGGAIAGFDEGRLGTIEVGKHADFVVLSDSPWEREPITAIDVVATIAGGELVYTDSSQIQTQ